MLARLQQVLSLAWLAGVLAVAASAAHDGWHAWHVAALAVLVAGQPALLAVEMGLARRLHRQATGERTPLAVVARAWAREIAFAVPTFLWRQPWRHASPPDHLDPATARGRRGVLLVHGFVCNRGLWRPWLHRLRARGTPFVAVSLAPVFGAIDDYVSIVEDAVRRLEAATGRPPVVVAHSMGGLATRAWLRAHDADARVHSVLTLGTPHDGTWLAALGPGLAANARQMRLHGDWVRALAAAEPPGRAARFTCFWSECDQIVFPAPTAVLPGSAARRLPGRGHVELAGAEEAWEALVERL